MKNESEAALERLCAVVYEDDGVPPERELGAKAHRRSRRRVAFKKRAQLCAQVEREVMLALAECVGEGLPDVVVHSVDPNPDGAHLRVTVYPSAGALEEGADLIELAHRLEALAPRLRAEVAAAIHRKRAPLLSFLVVPREATV